MQVEWADTVNHQTAVSSDECTASESQMVRFALSHNFRVNPSGVFLEVNNVNKVVYCKRKSVWTFRNRQEEYSAGQPDRLRLPRHRPRRKTSGFCGSLAIISRSVTASLVAAEP